MNYELGIVFRLESAEDVERVACFERPPRKYGPQDRAWVSRLPQCARRRGADAWLVQIQEESVVNKAIRSATAD